MTEISENDIPDIIRQEIEEFRNSNEGELDLRFFNNFYCHLPGGDMEVLSEEFLNRKTVDDRQSEKRKAQTMKEFCMECAEATEQEGITEQELLEARYNYQIATGEEQHNNTSKEIIDLLMPIYTNLRQRGYKRYPDLIA